MTVVQPGLRDGVLLTSLHESALDTDEPRIELSEKRGFISTDLTVGAKVTDEKSSVIEL